MGNLTISSVGNTDHLQQDGAGTMEELSLSDVWEQILARLDSSEIGPAQAGFLRLAQPVANIEGTILLAVPNDFTKRAIETNIGDRLTSSLSSIYGRDVRMAITIDPALENQSRDDVPQPAATASPASPEPVFTPEPATPSSAAPASAAPEPTPEQEFHSTDAVAESDDLDVIITQEESGRKAQFSIDAASTARLNPKYTFDTFVIGPSNRFAHAAAVAVAEGPARAYNPLFIYGGSGLGKTHLLHAIGHYALSLFPGLGVRYVNSEEFTNDFINAIREDKTEEFQRRYREVDILLVDDIQFIQGKEQTVEEFFHTFNTLHNANKQVVLTSDVPPKLLSGFEDRLRSRFEWGLLTDVQPPDLETRIAILQMKAAAEKIEVDSRVLEYIASRISANIRELEGCLLRVTAFANLTKQPIDLPLAQMVLKDIISDPQETEISVSLIMGQTASYFGCTIEQLCSTDRSRPMVHARQVAMYLCRELTDSSLPKIGEAFGGRDHTTVMHANKKISEQMAEQRQTFNHVTELTNRIKQKAREG